MGTVRTFLKSATVNMRHAHILKYVLLFGMFAVAYGASLDVVRAKGASSGLILPRFASLKSDKVNVRKGPGKEYPIDWVFRRAGLPVEIVKEFGNWRQIRDFQGSVGWVFHALLSGRRTMVVLPWEIDQTSGDTGKAVMTPIYDSASREADVLVNVEPGVIGSVLKCDRNWCNVSVLNFRGWILQKTLWGVYEPEVIE